MISCTCKLLSAKNEHPVRYDQSACPTHGPDAPNYFVDHDTIHCRITGKHVSLDEAAGMLNASPDELRMIAWGVVAKIGPQLREVTNERDSLRTRLAALSALVEEACDIGMTWAAKLNEHGDPQDRTRLVAIRAATKEQSK